MSTENLTLPSREQGYQPHHFCSRQLPDLFRRRRRKGIVRLLSSSSRPLWVRAFVNSTAHPILRIDSKVRAFANSIERSRHSSDSSIASKNRGQCVRCVLPSVTRRLFAPPRSEASGYVRLLRPNVIDTDTTLQRTDSTNRASGAALCCDTVIVSPKPNMPRNNTHRQIPDRRLRGHPDDNKPDNEERRRTKGKQ